MDIEGGELAVLRAWPWELYCVNAFSLENLADPARSASGVRVARRTARIRLRSPTRTGRPFRSARALPLKFGENCTAECEGTAAVAVGACARGIRVAAHRLSEESRTVGDDRSNLRARTRELPQARYAAAASDGGAIQCATHTSAHALAAGGNCRRARRRRRARGKFQQCRRVPRSRPAAVQPRRARSRRLLQERLHGLDTKMVWTGDACGNET